jgi:hypothetical protein
MIRNQAGYDEKHLIIGGVESVLDEIMHHNEALEARIARFDT